MGWSTEGLNASHSKSWELIYGGTKIMIITIFFFKFFIFRFCFVLKVHKEIPDISNILCSFDIKKYFFMKIIVFIRIDLSIRI